MRTNDIKEALDRVVDAFEKRPELGLATDSTSCVVEDGLQCRVSAGDFHADVDMPEVLGGLGGPTPGFYGRAAIISCIAIGIKITAVRAGVVLDKIAVDIDMDWDNLGIFGINNVSAGPIESRIVVRIQSEANTADVEEVVATALKNDPWLLAFSDPQALVPKIIVEETAA